MNFNKHKSIKCIIGDLIIIKPIPIYVNMIESEYVIDINDTNKIGRKLKPSQIKYEKMRLRNNYCKKIYQEIVSLYPDIETIYSGQTTFEILNLF